MIKLNGYLNQSATFNKTGEIADNTPVAISENLCVVAPDTEDALFGVCISSDENAALVQTHGYVELPYTVAPTVGYQTILATKDGVKTGAQGRPCFVVSVDTDTQRCGIIL